MEQVRNPGLENLYADTLHKNVLDCIMIYKCVFVTQFTESYTTHLMLSAKDIDDDVS